MNTAVPQLEQRLSYLFHRVSSHIALIGNRHFRKHGLNHFSARILVLLLEYKEMRAGELVELLVLPQSTISTQLLALHKRQLISRRRSRQDNRSVIVRLTEKGIVVAQDCNELSIQVQQKIVEMFAEHELTAGYAFLRKVEHLLGELEHDVIHPFSD